MILLDTFVIISAAAGGPMAAPAMETLDAARKAHEPVSLSSISIWELCLLESRDRTGPLIGGDGAAFFRRVERLMGLSVIDIDPAIAIESRRLPEPFHQDPADRFIVATARIHGLTLITSDRLILDYAARGHVKALPC